jgi:DNA-binding NarL/FixJ family response regulator
MPESDQVPAQGCLFLLQSRPKKILVVDDSCVVRRVVRSVLERQSEFQVCGEAIDGVDAIEKAKALEPDLIILDLAMPRMNGAEAAMILRGAMPQVRIVLFTMYGGTLGPSLISTIGFDAVISKPDGVTKLASCVQALLGTA